MKKTVVKKILAVLTALWMLAGCMPALAGEAGNIYGALQTPEDWMNLQLYVQWTDDTQPDQPMISYAMPVEGSNGVFWVYVPQEQLENLTLSIFHPNHPYVFTPESGSLLTGVADAGMTLDGPCIFLTGTVYNEENLPVETAQFLLYISTQAAQPILPEPTEEPTPEPTEEPTPEPTEEPTPEPTEEPTPEPTEEPTPEPTEEPTPEPTEEPTPEPTEEPTPEPTEEPTPEPTEEPTPEPTEEPTPEPTEEPTSEPTEEPTPEPTEEPTPEPTEEPTPEPTEEPTPEPAAELTEAPAEESTVPAEEPEEEQPEEPVSEPVMETPIPLGNMINRFARTNKSVRFREGMSKDSAILKELSKNEHVYALREEVSEKTGEAWTAVLYRGRFGYVMSEYLDVLTQADSDIVMSDPALTPIPPMTEEELNELISPKSEQIQEPEPEEQPEETFSIQNETDLGDSLRGGQLTLSAGLNEPEPEDDSGTVPGDDINPENEKETDVPEDEDKTDQNEEPELTETPEPPETIAETPIPTGEMINRFALTTSQVHVREKPGKNSAKIATLKSKTEVYALREEINEEGNLWTAVLYKDKIRYISSQYLSVQTQEKSDQIMGRRKTKIEPMTAEEYAERTGIELQTPVPTETPTPVPTDTPTPVPTDTPTPVPTDTPTPVPTDTPTPVPTDTPTPVPTETPTPVPTETPTPVPTETPTPVPTETTTPVPTDAPTPEPTATSAESASAATEIPTETTAAPAETTAPANATAEPPQIAGYAITIGDGAYVRNWPDSYSVIMEELPANRVVFVNAQIYVDGVAWHQIQYGGNIGYVRADMLRMMGEAEVLQYLNNLNATAEPVAEITVQPYNGDTLSSYGYVTKDKVNFREGPSTTSKSIRKLNQFAYCLVLGTTDTDGQTWYRVNYNGTSGYIRGDFFRHLTLSEWDTFLGSADYLAGISNNASAGSSDSSGNSNASGSTEVVSAEDQRVNVWTNPDSGLVVSYAPFNPYATPAPLATEAPNEYLDSLLKDVQNGTVSREQLESLLTSHYQGSENQDQLIQDGMAYIEEQLGTPEPVSTPEVTAEPMETVQPEPETEETEGGTNWPGIILGIAAVILVGGGAYVWYSSVQRKRKEAEAAAKKRAAQSKHAQQRQARGTSASRASGTAPRSTGADREAGSGRSEWDARPQSDEGQSRNAPSGNGKPYSGRVENPYARYSTKNEDSDSDYTASFRPEEAREQKSPQHRRRRSTDQFEIKDDDF